MGNTGKVLSPSDTKITVVKSYLFDTPDGQTILIKVKSTGENSTCSAKIIFDPAQKDEQPNA